MWWGLTRDRYVSPRTVYLGLMFTSSSNAWLSSEAYVLIELDNDTQWTLARAVLIIFLTFFVKITRGQVG